MTDLSASPQPRPGGRWIATGNSVVNQPTVRYRSASGDHVLAAVSLQGDQCAVPAGPLGQRLAQRGEQDVVDLGAVCRGDLVQQRVGLLGAEPYRYGAHRPGRGGGGPVGGKLGRGAAGCPGPVGQILVEPAASGPGSASSCAQRVNGVPAGSSWAGRPARMSW